MLPEEFKGNFAVNKEIEQIFILVLTVVIILLYDFITVKNISFRIQHKVIFIGDDKFFILCHFHPINNKSDQRGQSNEREKWKDGQFWIYYEP